MNSKEPFAKNFKNTWQLHLMMLVPMAFVILFAYVPMVGIVLGFKKYIATKGIFGSPWLGLENFQTLFVMPDFSSALFNTFFIAILKIVIGFPVPIIVALLLNEVRRMWFKKTIQTLIYLPYFLSWAVLGGLFLDVFSSTGVVASIFETLNIPPVDWLGNSNSFLTLLIGSDVWKNFGYNTIVYLAALTGIDMALYEAAKVDGAGRFKQVWHITLPGILPMIMLLGILSLGNVLNAGFEQIFVLMNSMVEDKAQIIDTLVYQITFTDRNYGVATALGMFKSLISMAFIFTGWFVANKFSNYRVF